MIAFIPCKMVVVGIMISHWMSMCPSVQPVSQSMYIYISAIRISIHFSFLCNNLNYGPSIS